MFRETGSMDLMAVTNVFYLLSENMVRLNSCKYLFIRCRNLNEYFPENMHVYIYLHWMPVLSGLS